MDKVRERRMGLAGHCVRHLELMASTLTLWEAESQPKAELGEGTLTHHLNRRTSVQQWSKQHCRAQDPDARQEVVEGSDSGVVAG